MLQMFKKFLNMRTKLFYRVDRALFTNFCNPLDDWLYQLISTNHLAVYIIRGLTQDLKKL